MIYIMSANSDDTELLDYYEVYGSKSEAIKSAKKQIEASGGELGLVYLSQKNPSTYEDYIGKKKVVVEQLHCLWSATGELGYRWKFGPQECHVSR